jgi:hypothetical protein
LVLNDAQCWMQALKVGMALHQKGTPVQYAYRSVVK